MPEPQRFPPDDPREWLNRARSDLALARQVGDKIYLEDLCFHAQQAAEKAIKALLIRHKVEFPYIHNLARLLELVEEVGVSVPSEVKRAARLTRYAVLTRYPGLGGAPTNTDYQDAIRIAHAVLDWATQQVHDGGGNEP